MRMNRLRVSSAWVALSLGVYALPACGQASQGKIEATRGPSQPAQPAQLAQLAQASALTQSTTANADGDGYTFMTVRPEAPADAEWRNDNEFLLDAARNAWLFIDHSYQRNTGLAAVLWKWDHSTLWDIASGFAGLYSAKELGLLSRQD